VHAALTAQVSLPVALPDDTRALFFQGKACINFTAAQVAGMPDIAFGFDLFVPKKEKKADVNCALVRLSGS
jgi:hypothetical protein